MDAWNSREELSLIDGLLRNGDTNWGPVVQYLTQLSGPERPANYYTEEKCASQYQRLQRRTAISESKTDRTVLTASEPNKKNWKDTCHTKLVQDRIKELKAAVDEAKKNYYFYKQQIASLKTGVLDDMLNMFLNPETTEKESSLRKVEPENVSTDVPQESVPATKEPEVVAEVLVESEVTLTEETQDNSLQTKEVTTEETETVIEEETSETVAVPSTVVVVDDSKAGNSNTEETVIEVGEEVLVEEVAEELPAETQPVTTTEELETVEETVVSTVDTVAPEAHAKEAEKTQEIEEAVEPSEVIIKEELPTLLPETTAVPASQLEDVPAGEKEVPASEEPVSSPLAQDIPAPTEEPVVIKEEVIEPAIVEQPITEAVDTSLPVEEEPPKKVDIIESDDEIIPQKVLRSKLQPKAEPLPAASNTVSTENIPEPAEVPVVDTAVVPAPVETEETKDISKPLSRTDSTSTSTEINVELLNFNKSATAFFKALGAFDNASLLNKPLPSELSVGILRPMDLGVIRKNVESQTVQTQKDLVRDILLMFSNIFLAYESQSQVYREAQTLYKQTMELIKETFPNVIPDTNEKVQDAEPSLPELPLKETPQLGKSRKGGKRQNSPMNDDSVGKRKRFVLD